MKTYDQIMEELERKTIRDTELICKNIVLEIEKTCKIHFPVEESKITYGVLLQAILLDYSFITYRPMALKLIQKYDFHDENFVSRFLITINKVGLPDYLKGYMEQSFKNLPFCKRMEKLKNGYIIETKSGIVEAYQLSETTDNKILADFLKLNIFQRRCHEAVEICSKYLPKEKIITSELNALFGGTYCHSYFKEEEKEDVIDISANTLYKGNTFDTFYKPIELQCIKSSELYDYIKKLPEEKNENHCKVLRLAIERKIKMEEES